MFYLYYNNLEKKLFLVDEKYVGKGIELLETNASLEALVLRSHMYEKQYGCKAEQKVEQKVSHFKLHQYKNRKGPKKRVSEKTRERLSRILSGEFNGRWKAIDPPHIRESKSRKLKEYYKFNIHGKSGYKDSDETRRKKSLNNCNKGGWVWICNYFTKEEKRWYEDTIPPGWRRGRLYGFNITKN